jgi:hypothetical protein
MQQHYLNSLYFKKIIPHRQYNTTAKIRASHPLNLSLYLSLITPLKLHACMHVIIILCAAPHLVV